MSARRVGIDAGSLITKVAIADGVPPAVLTQATSARDHGRALCAAVSMAGAGADVPVVVAVPDNWLNGTAEGGRRQEALRRVAEDELGLRRVAWAGQLAAVAAVAASGRGFAQSGTYLVCDVGGRGVRMATCEVSGRAVRQRSVHVAVGGGWRDFDSGVRAALGVPNGPGLARWHLTAMDQERRARMVLDRAMGDPGFRDARAYTLDGYLEVSAGQLMDCFAPTGDRIREGVAAVLGGVAPVAVALTGGLAWFPLAGRVLGDVTGVAPDVLGPDAVARGALLIADEQASIAPHGLPPVSLPMHQVRNGLLEELSTPLPWTWSFAREGDESFVIDEPGLALDIGSRRVGLAVAGLASGQYRIGVRPGWSGTGVLVLRRMRPGPASPVTALAAADDGVHVLPLDIHVTQEASR